MLRANRMLESFSNSIKLYGTDNTEDFEAVLSNDKVKRKLRRKRSTQSMIINRAAIQITLPVCMIDPDNKAS